MGLQLGLCVRVCPCAFVLVCVRPSAHLCGCTHACTHARRWVCTAHPEQPCAPCPSRVALDRGAGASRLGAQGDVSVEGLASL